MNFYVDIEDAAGTKLGGGPLTSVTAWSYTARMDRAGAFSCTLLATDAQAAIIQRKRVIRAWSLLGTTWTEVGAGIIDAIERRPQVDGTVEMTLQGDDLIRELSYRSVQNLALRSGGNAVTHASAVSSVASYAPAGWSITADSAPPVNALYGRFNGESVLAALIQVGERSRAHFYRGTGRALTFASTFTASGVRAIQASGDLVPETCAITQMTQRQTSYDLITRIYPRGSGNADVQLTLGATTRTAGAGYTLDKTNNYIEHAAGVAAYGLIEAWLDYREVGPVSNSDADLQAAANALYDAALTELDRRVDEAAASYYDLALAECSVLLRPMQTVRLVYRDLDAGLDVDADLNILEATWEVTSEGLRTTGLVVATVDRWPADDRDVIVGEVVQGRTYQSLPQLNANSYVTAYRAPVDADNMAAFRFRFGPEVVQVQQVLFEFQILALESTVRNISSRTVSSASGGGTTASSNADSGHTHNVTIGDHTHGVTVGDHTHTVSIPAHDHDVTIDNHTHGVTVGNHTHGVTIGNHTHTVSIPAHDHTVSISAHTHSVTTANHSHGISLYKLAAADASNRAVYHQGSSNLLGVIMAGTGVYDTPTSESGGATTVTSASGGGTTATSSQLAASTPTSSSGGGTTVTSASGGAATVTSASGGETTATSSQLAESTPTSSSGGGTTVTSESGGGTTATSASGGSHSHTVTVASHTHDVTPVIGNQYGIFREASAYTLALSQMEYRVNGGSWTALSGAASAGDGWYRLDITSAVVSTSVVGRPLQSNNVLEVRSSIVGLDITYMASGGVGANEDWLITTSTAHNLAVGNRISVSGTDNPDLLAFYGSDPQIVTVKGVNSSTVIAVAAPFSSFPEVVSGAGDAILKLNHTAMIDAQLSVRNVIQAIAYA